MIFIDLLNFGGHEQAEKENAKAERENINRMLEMEKQTNTKMTAQVEDSERKTRRAIEEKESALRRVSELELQLEVSSKLKYFLVVHIHDEPTDLECRLFF